MGPFFYFCWLVKMSFTCHSLQGVKNETDHEKVPKVKAPEDPRGTFGEITLKT